MKAVQISLVSIGIETDNAISELVANELNCKNEITDVDIVVKIDKENLFESYIPTIYSAKGSMNCNESSYFVDYLGEVNYLVTNLFCSGKTELYINHNKNSLKKLVMSLFKKKIIQEKDMILSYSLFWYVLHLTLLKKNTAFIHGGVFSNMDLKTTTIITGTGGCGKTSTLFKLLEDKNYSYLAEDFGIIDGSGYTYFNPKPVSVYASDVEFGQTILREYLDKKLTFLEKSFWRIQRRILKRNPMKRVKPKDLLGHRIENKKEITTVLYFIRNSDEELCVRDIKLSELIERTLDASMRELKTLNELLLLMRANAPLSYQIPSFDDIRKKTCDIYESAFKLTDNKLVTIPYKTKPDKLILFLKENKLI